MAKTQQKGRGKIEPKTRVMLQTRATTGRMTSTPSTAPTSKATASAAGLELSSTPIFELASLSHEDTRVNHTKLRDFIELNREFPGRYRSLIWRFLLKLPENSQAFTELVSRDVHPAFEDIYNTYPIQNRKVLQRLQNCCSHLVHWAPVLAEASYLPTLVYPFVLVFGVDELACLETCMTILMVKK